MLTDASTIPNLLPSTSRHSTPTSLVDTPNLLQRKNSYTSNAKRSICRVLNNSWDASFVKSLNPHWVSLLLIPSKKVITPLKTADMNFRCHFRSTLPYSLSLRDPTTITSGLLAWISFNLCQTCSSSEKVVAPSASTISAYFPCTRDMPARTAPPLPLLVGYSTTTKLRSSFWASYSATLVVWSLLPSLTTMISCLICLALKYLLTSASMSGILSSSL